MVPLGCSRTPLLAAAPCGLVLKADLARRQASIDNRILRKCWPHGDQSAAELVRKLCTAKSKVHGLGTSQRYSVKMQDFCCYQHYAYRPNALAMTVRCLPAVQSSLCRGCILRFLHAHAPLRATQMRTCIRAAAQPG